MSHRIEINPEDIHVTFSDVKGVSNDLFGSEFCHNIKLIYVKAI